MANTSKKPAASTPEEPIQIELRNPFLAAILAWLIPGAGHFYQGRWAKGALFSVCIIGTYIFGLLLGEGKVVQTGGTPDLVQGPFLMRAQQRWTFFPQAFVGAPAAIAVVQHMRVSGGGTPLFAGWFAPPRSADELRKRYNTAADRDELAYWNEKLNSRYDIGMLYTMVAGLLNLLAIYDALAGPVIAEDKKDDDEDDKKKKAKDGDKDAAKHDSEKERT